MNGDLVVGAAIIGTTVGIYVALWYFRGTIALILKTQDEHSIRLDLIEERLDRK